MLHEDNRYFPSHKTGSGLELGDMLCRAVFSHVKTTGDGIPPRLCSSDMQVDLLSCHDFGNPSGSRSVGDAAVSFGVAMGWNIGFGVLKEFLPDMLRPLTKKGNTDHASSNSSASRR